MRTDRQFLKQYSTAVQMWAARYDTWEIAAQLGVPEPVVCRWIWNYREIERAA